MARKLYNMLQVPLAADITAGATTITFTAPLKEWGEDNIATIASPDILALRVGYELMHVTAYTSGASTATVLRGQEGSTAVAHTEGEILRHVATDLDMPDLSTYAPIASPTFTGEATAPSFKATGKTGATATPITLAGGTASGAPASGAHVKGEIVFDDTGEGWYCTVAGTPGTWVTMKGAGGGGGDIATDAIWDAAGDLVYGTGSNAAVRLAIGAALRVLRVNAGATAPEWADLSTLYAPLSVIQYSQPTDGATRNSTTLGSLSTPWTDDVTTTAALPRIKYTVDISSQNAGDAFIYAALAVGGTIVDQGRGYLGGANRETRIHFNNILDPGAAGSYTFEVFIASTTAVTVNTTADTSTASSLTLDGVSSMQLQAVAVA